MSVKGCGVLVSRAKKRWARAHLSTTLGCEKLLGEYSPRIEVGTGKGLEKEAPGCARGQFSTPSPVPPESALRTRRRRGRSTAGSNPPYGLDGSLGLQKERYRAVVGQLYLHSSSEDSLLGSQAVAHLVVQILGRVWIG